MNDFDQHLQVAIPDLQVNLQCHSQAGATAVSCKLGFLKATKFPALIHATPEKEW